MPARMSARRSSRIALILAALVAAGGLAGCFGATEGGLGDPRTVTATGKAYFSATGWGYGGGGQSVDATFEGTFNDADNTGTATIRFKAGEEEVVVTFDKFAEAAGKTFQDGGVEFDILEHGDSGVADASVPKLLALVAAWGEATVTAGGEPEADPMTGAPTWTAHVMASDTTVRGADGKITKADGTTPYDPASPADAKTVEGDRQLLFILKPHARAAEPAPVNETQSASVQSPQYSESYAFQGEVGGMGLVRITLVGASGSPLGGGSATVVVKNPSGVETSSTNAALTPGTGPATAEATFVTDQAGEYVIEVSGNGVFEYELAYTVDYTPMPGVTLTWDDFTIE